MPKASVPATNPCPADMPFAIANYDLMDDCSEVWNVTDQGALGSDYYCQTRAGGGTNGSEMCYYQGSHAPPANEWGDHNQTCAGAEGGLKPIKECALPPTKSSTNAITSNVPFTVAVVVLAAILCAILHAHTNS